LRKHGLYKNRPNVNLAEKRKTRPALSQKIYKSKENTNWTRIHTDDTD